MPVKVFPEGQMKSSPAASLRLSVETALEFQGCLVWLVRYPHRPLAASSSDIMPFFRQRARAACALFEIGEQVRFPAIS